MPRTITDIARLAGVSKQTVSRVLNNRGRVSPQTRERVQLLCERLGYRPNVAAKTLATKAKQNVGVLMVAVGEHGTSVSAIASYAECLEGLQRALSQANLNMMLAFERVVAPPDGPPGGLPKMIAEGHVDGLFVLMHITEALAGEIRSLAVPFVVIDGERIPGVPTVNVTEEKTTELLVHHLADLGHRRIAYVNSSLDTRFFRARLRAEGYMRAMGSRELPPMPGWDSTDNAEVTFERLFTRAHPPTAVITWDDEDAAVVMRFLERRGLTVPRDVSVASAHARMMARFLPKRLTHVLRPTERMVEHAVRLLTGRMTKSDQSPRSLSCDPELAFGETTGPCLCS